MTNGRCVRWVMTKADNEPFWVLHGRPFRNSSLVVELFCHSRGRVGAVARGGRGKPLLQPFVPLEGTLHGRGELLTLGAFEARGAAPALEGRALYCGLYMNELLMRLLHRHDPHPELLGWYEQTLRALVDDETPLDLLLRRFEFRTLEILGYGFSLTHDVTDSPLHPERCYRLDPEQGLVADAQGFSGAQILQLAEGSTDPGVRRVGRDLMRQALAPHLGERPLTSRELFR